MKSLFTIKKLCVSLTTIALVFPVSHANLPSQPTAVSYDLTTDIHHPVHASSGMVATADAYATQVGLDILKQGGNAIDAAAAIGFALAVTYPQAGNLGGGGFMLIRLQDGEVTAIDFREVAPKRAHRDLFLDDKGNVDSRLSLVSPLAVGVPGTTAGLSYALKKYGTFSLANIIEPAYKLAYDGITVNDNLAYALTHYGKEVLIHHSNSKGIFFKADGSAWQKGEKFVQKNLAASLALIAKEGADAFYKGAIAHEIVNEMKKQGGLISYQDLADYTVIERQPVKGHYRGYEIYSMPAPSSGGIHIIQLLNILENFNLSALGQNSAQTIHLMAEAMKYVYADRSEYLGDPAFTTVPVKALTSKAYAKTIAERINFNKATPSSDIKPGHLQPYESDQTTHYSVVDQWGNAVSVTYTLNTNFGSGIVAGNSGILLNNEMDDFSAKPGVPNIYGLIGGEANAIEAGKRPLSSMSPTIITKEGNLAMVTGSPGGARIITTVLQMIINSIDFNMNISDASHAPRIHHQWYPDELRIEKGLSVDTLRLLQQKGYNIAIKPTMGSTQSIVVTPQGLFGAADPRTQNDAVAGY